MRRRTPCKTFDSRLDILKLFAFRAKIEMQDFYSKSNLMHFTRLFTKPPPYLGIAAPVWTPRSSTLVGDSELIVFTWSFLKKAKTIPDLDCSHSLYEAGIGYMWIMAARQNYDLSNGSGYPSTTLKEASRIHRWGRPGESQYSMSTNAVSMTMPDIMADTMFSGYMTLLIIPLEEEGDLSVVKSVLVRDWGVSVKKVLS